jgi:hypothetical protein
MFAQACSLEHESQYSGSDIERQALLQNAWRSLGGVAIDQRTKVVPTELRTVLHGNHRL